MGMVRLTVGGRSYEVACRDGEEARLEMLAREVEASHARAVRAVGRGAEGRELLLTALLLADSLDEARARASAQQGETAQAVARAVAEARADGQEAQAGAEAAADMIDTLAQRIEALAAGLEKAVGTS